VSRLFLSKTGEQKRCTGKKASLAQHPPACPSENALFLCVKSAQSPANWSCSCREWWCLLGTAPRQAEPKDPFMSKFYLFFFTLYPLQASVRLVRASGLDRVPSATVSSAKEAKAFSAADEQ